MKTSTQSQIMKIAAEVVEGLVARQDIAGRIGALKQLAANDNSARISKPLLEQLADIMAFMSQRRGTSLDVMTVELCTEMGVNSLHNLCDSQFKAALDYVLTYKIA